MKEGRRIVAPKTRVGGSVIEGWLSRVQAVLLILERDAPSVLGKFRRLKFRRRVPEYRTDDASNSAYRDEADNLIDFDFDAIDQAVRALDVARQVVDLKLSSGTRPRRTKKTQSKRGQNTTQAVEQRPNLEIASVEPPVLAMSSPTARSDKDAATGKDKGLPFDKERLRKARNLHHMQQRVAADWFGISPRHYVRWENPRQTATMHHDHHDCYEQFVTSAETGVQLPQRCVSKMSLAEVSNKAP